MSLFRRLVTGFALLNPIEVRVEFLVGRVAPGHDLVLVILFRPVLSLHRRYTAI